MVTSSSVVPKVELEQQGITVEYVMSGRSQVVKKKHFMATEGEDYSERATQFVAEQSGVLSFEAFCKKNKIDPKMPLMEFRRHMATNFANWRINAAEIAGTTKVVTLSPSISPVQWHVFYPFTAGDATVH